MDVSDLKSMNETDLDEHVATARRELVGLRMQHAMGELENTSKLRIAKRDLARALTVARQRSTTETR
jgi:large subunit ribosomal protein L29